MEYKSLSLSGMEGWDLAPGDPFSQDSSAGEFRYSQSSECPSAPFNSAESDYRSISFQFLPSASEGVLAKDFEIQDSLPEETFAERAPTSSQSHSRYPSPIAGLLDIDREDDEILLTSASKSMSHPQNGLSFSDSLGLSDFDKVYGPKIEEDRSRQFVCDPRLLEEETQISDVCMSITVGQKSHMRSSSQLLVEEVQVFCPDVPMLEKPLVLPKGENTARKILTSSKTVEIRPPFAACKQEPCTSADVDTDIIWRWQNRERTPLQTARTLDSDLNTSTESDKRESQVNTVLKSGPMKAAHSQEQSGDGPNFDDNKENTSQSISGAVLWSNSISSPSSSEEKQEDVFHNDPTDSSTESAFPAHKSKRLRSRDLKSFWPSPCREAVKADERQSEQGSGGWICPRLSRKYRVQGKQRTIDAWVR